MRENVYILLVMLFTVPLAGELKFYPFNDDFRVSFGTTAFFFFLLWMRKIPSVVTGALVGMVIILFRILVDWMFLDQFDWSASFHLHSPAFFFYLTFASLFSLARINDYHHRPLAVGLLGTLVEIMANMVELTLRSSTLETVITLSVIGKISSIALIRSFFVLSFFNMIQLRQAKWMEEQQRSRHEHILMLVSSLYEESIQLKKTLQNAEDITRNCYDLYRNLKDPSLRDIQNHSQRALRIAGQVHEIKKDNQRIYAGLSKMISNENVADYMSMEELGSIIVRTNQKYARLLSKEITFDVSVNVSYSLYHIYTTLTLVNNLVANAVESIKDKGTIMLSIHRDKDWIELSVSDDGPGIMVKNKELLFEPGFTTKYGITGQPSTGIGLSYVKEVVESLQGTITIHAKTNPNETVFIIRLPMESLVQKG